MQHRVKKENSQRANQKGKSPLKSARSGLHVCFSKWPFLDYDQSEERRALTF